MDTSVKIDRSQPFDPESFLGWAWRGSNLAKGWSIVEQDQRSLSLTELDVAKVELKTMLTYPDVGEIIGEETIRRLNKAGYIRLDAKAFELLLKNQEMIPESWREYGSISFDGTVLQAQYGGRYGLWMFYGLSRWHMHPGPLGDEDNDEAYRGPKHPSAVLPASM